MSRLIDADAYAAEMKLRQDACKEIMDAAKEDDNWEMYDRMSAKFSVFTEAKLTLDNMPTVNAAPVRCGECKKGVMNELYNEKYCNGEFHALDWFCADGERLE